LCIGTNISWHATERATFGAGRIKTALMTAPFEVMVGRIETLALDAVVNAANKQLLPGSGVDGALRAAAGPDLTKHTARMPAIAEGEAVITPGFQAPARFIIHVAAPIWNVPGPEGEKVAGLAKCYMSALRMAASRGFGSIAFPCLGTGNFGWPRGFACAIAIASCEQALEDAPSLKRVVFCCFTEDDAALYRAGLSGDAADAAPS
jgi:O-acetyl-ADP-ribose deacetylase (regulator of RNase III)